MKIPPEAAGLSLRVVAEAAEVGLALAKLAARKAGELLREDAINPAPGVKLPETAAKAGEEVPPTSAPGSDSATAIATSPRRPAAQVKAAQPRELPHFDMLGFLPAGISDTTLDVFASRFVVMPRRQIEFEGMETALRGVANSWRGDAPPHVFVHGKWVTSYDPEGFAVSFPKDDVDLAKLGDHDAILADLKPGPQQSKYGGTILPFEGRPEKIPTTLRNADYATPGVVRLDLSSLVGDTNEQPLSGNWFDNRLNAWQAKESQRLQKDPNRMSPPAYRVLTQDGAGPWTVQWNMDRVPASLPELKPDGSWEPGEFRPHEVYVSNNPHRWLDPFMQRLITYEVQIGNPTTWQRVGGHPKMGTNVVAEGGYRLLRRVSDQEVHRTFLQPKGIGSEWMNGSMFSDSATK